MPRDQFQTSILRNKLTKNPNRVKDLARFISEFRITRGGLILQTQVGQEPPLVLGDIEDFALGFMQNNVKLFMFGQAHKSLGAFEQKVVI